MSLRVFISYASEDRDRFVIEFAEKLRSKGIDAWLDRWEILPGDSLIDKIFEEGIGTAEAMIVVISKYSVNKRWVREELNAGTIKRIEGRFKLIPVVIDDCEVPECLKSTVWQRVKDFNSYDSELQSIVNAVYEHREKPALGNPPPYTQVATSLIAGLNKLDTIVLKLACERLIGTDAFEITTHYVFEKTKPLGISEGEVSETLDILNRRGYIEGESDDSGTIFGFCVTLRGFESYARCYMPGYGSIVESVKSEIINYDRRQSFDIATSLNKSKMLIEYILRGLKRDGLISLERLDSGELLIRDVSPELKRTLGRP